jgi:hypothetical protein
MKMHGHCGLLIKELPCMVCLQVPSPCYRLWNHILIVCICWFVWYLMAGWIVVVNVSEAFGSGM